MIETLSIRNFKAFSSWQDLTLAPITLIYGPNSSGKSSIIHSLVLLKQSITRPSLQGGLVSNGEYVDLGDYSSMIHGHAVDETMSFKFSFRPVKKLGQVDVAEYSAFGRSRKKHYELDYGYSRGGGGYAGFSYLQAMKAEVRNENDGELVFATDVASGLPGSDVVGLPEKIALAKRYKFNGINSWRESRAFLDRKVRGAKAMELDKFLDSASFRSDLNYSTPSMAVAEGRSEINLQALFQMNLVFSDLAKDLKDKFSSVTYLGPLRSHPSRFYAPKVDQSESVGKQGEFVAKFIFESAGVGESINEWFSFFEVPYELTATNLGNDVTGPVINLQLKDKRTGVTVGPADVGFGIGQMLPIIVEGVVRDDSVICIEQPEIHLHPRLQAHLANFFVSTCDKNQWIVETHSEALMLRLQSMISRGQVDPEDIAVLYVEPTATGGEVIRIRLDKDGDFIDAWPEGFFEERIKEKLGGLK
jgi:hypothetical protein